ncbi:proline racemase family protein [Desulforhopalus singaporensis]|uniref:Proline racemase n=1 Tax=Desulforhopalus singaporensis TaxID=91360 RepID=A0A1H0KLC4_9BACT|nr:proline racemase family protein [Desulforhopalus singaporensis]SDO56562.1 proline racemase [Desulforhopalus singaporensis]
MGFKRTITAVDTHAGEPMRVITGGVIDVPGNTVFEKMKWLQKEDDQLRRMMMREPRGYPPLCCNLVVPSSHPEADAGFIIMEQHEYPGMSGGNAIAVATVLLETGMLPMKEPVTELTLEAPAGLIKLSARCKNGKVTRVTFTNVPCFVVAKDVVLDVPHLGKVTVDIVWGGVFFVLADVAGFGFEILPENGSKIARTCELVRAAANEKFHDLVHPENHDFKGISLAQLYSSSATPGVHGRNCVTVPSGLFDWEKPESWYGALDRSPCGTGTCARMAQLYEKGRLGLNEEFVQQGILDLSFTGKLIGKTRVGPYEAVIPTVSGQAWITGYSTYVLDPTDPFPEGYTVGDLWG